MKNIIISLFLFALFSDAKNFSKVRMELDGSVNLKIIQGKEYKLEWITDQECEKEESISGSELFLKAKKKEKDFKLKIVLVLPEGVKKIKVAAGLADVNLQDYKGEVAVDAGKLKFFSNRSLQYLKINAGHAKVILHDWNYDINVNAGMLNLEAFIIDSDVKKNALIKAGFGKILLRDEYNLRNKKMMIKVNSPSLTIEAI